MQKNMPPLLGWGSYSNPLLHCTLRDCSRQFIAGSSHVKTFCTKQNLMYRTPNLNFFGVVQ
ncbi:MAG: hypothetical protein GY874_14195 [Desulfobacteraceae bacterium]|nr:hypothetical protein [Desulfobacteraceae bacterium]